MKIAFNVNHSQLKLQNLKELGTKCQNCYFPTRVHRENKLYLIEKSEIFSNFNKIKNETSNANLKFLYFKKLLFIHY